VDEETPEETLKRIGITLKRWQAWINAAEAHVWPKPGSVLYLAGVAKAWREYAVLKLDRSLREHGVTPAPRSEDAIGLPAVPKLDDVTELELRTRADIFEAFYTRAFDMKDRNFCRRLLKAFALPDDKISRPLSAIGAVVCEWKELGGLEGKRPSKQAIRARVESIPGAPKVTDRHWERIWEDGFVAALLRCR
jgi:hypothetical protein